MKQCAHIRKPTTFTITFKSLLILINIMKNTVDHDTYLAHTLEFTFINL